tara:strand:- start:32 stop:1216 length:1185 start_codon:yes stop_codon:yes gene_type:complete
MLQVDVTQSCRSANSSGIQVVTRKLFGALRAQAQVEPVAWDSILRRYARLGPTEIKRMETPFPNNYRPTARPNKKDNPLWKTLVSSIFRLSRRIKWEEFHLRGNAMLFPEVFRDARTRILPRKLSSTIPSSAIFYDVYVLKESEKTPPARALNFMEYAKFAASRDLVLCISNETKEDLQRLIMPQVERPGYSAVEPLPVERPEKIPESPANGELPLILCVSTLGYQKNHFLLLDAADKLWQEGIDFRLELIGKADPTWSSRVIARIDKLKASGRNLSWLRHVDDKALCDRYRQSTFTVYPSRYEGFGLPILESIAHGKPCICGSNGAIGEVSSGGGCLQVDQNDLESLAAGIKKLLEDESLVKKLRDQALRRELGSWEGYAERFLERFGEISGE